MQNSGMAQCTWATICVQIEVRSLTKETSIKRYVALHRATVEHMAFKLQACWLVRAAAL